MIIQAKIFRWLNIVIPVLAIPTVWFDMVEPSGRFGHILHVCAFPCLLALGGSGALAAILQRCGVIEFHYSEDDKRRFYYRMARFVAALEYGHRRPFSRRYYQSYGLKHPDDN